MNTLYAVQHCQSEHHLNGMLGGATDWPLTPLGIRQAHEIGRRLADQLGQAPRALYSSDLTRARQTAEILSMYLNTGVIYRPKLREQNLGVATGKSAQWLEEHRSVPAPGAPRLSYRAVPDAESDEELYLRVGTVVEELERERVANIIAVGHGGSLRMLAAYFLQVPLPLLESILFLGSAGGVSVMEKTDDGRRALRHWNNTEYVGGA